jgi:hypothetical protein
VRRVCLALLLALCAGCIVNMGTTKTVTPPDAHVPVPDKYKADQAPELVDSEVPGCRRAPSLDPNLYYCAKDEHWFRYALNRWYLAFAWDGNWFPVGDTDLPLALAKSTPAPEVVKKSRDDRLKELDKKLEQIELEKEQPPKSGN